MQICYGTYKYANGLNKSIIDEIIISACKTQAFNFRWQIRVRERERKRNKVQFLKGNQT